MMLWPVSSMNCVSSATPNVLLAASTPIQKTYRPTPMSAPFNSRRGGGGAGKGGGTRLRPGIIRISDEGKTKEYINGNRSSCTRLTLFDRRIETSQCRRE